MTKKVRLTSLATAVVMFLTMSGANIKKVNDYNGEHIEFSIIQTAEAETKLSKVYFDFPEPSKIKNQDEYSYGAFLTEFMFVYNVITYAPEVYNMLTKEEQDLLSNTLFTFTGDFSSDIKSCYKDTIEVVVKLEGLLSDYLDTLIPLQKTFNPKNGEEMYTLAMRIIIESQLLFGLTCDDAKNMALHDEIVPVVEQLWGYVAKMGEGYDFEANFKTDCAKIKPLYEKIYKNLEKFYNNKGVKMSKSGTNLIGKKETDNIISSLEPVDENVVIPFEKMLDPFGSVDEPFEEEMAVVGMAFALADFYEISGLSKVIYFTGYDNETGNGKILWDYALGMANGQVHYKKGDFEKLYPAYQEFVSYLIQYFRICHLDRPELVAENGEQIETYTNGMYYATSYLKFFYGSYLNDRTFAENQFDSSNCYNLNGEILKGQHDVLYANEEYVQAMQASYKQAYQEVLDFCNILCNQYLENGEELKPIVKTK